MKSEFHDKKSTTFAKGVAYNFVIAFLALVLTWIFGGPKIDIEFKTALLICAFLFIAFLALMIFSPYSAPPYAHPKKKRITGHYKYIRHPNYAAIIYLLNPALAIIFRSWIYLLGCIVIYFIWKTVAEDEEVATAREFGEVYSQYRLTANLLFPDLYSISWLLYFFFIGTSVFIAVFVVLNFSSLLFRYVSWEKKSDGLPTAASENDEVKANQDSGNKGENKIAVGFPAASEARYDKPDSIVIEKIRLNAPLIYAQSADQRELNQDLNSGVVIYPGSDQPGKIGNFFLTGHSSVYPWNKTIYGQVFAAIDKLEIGDTAVIYLQQHKYEYKITNKYTVTPKDVQLVHPTNEAKITLMTCWPIGTNLKRLIVEGKLIK